MHANVLVSVINPDGYTSFEELAWKVEVRFDGTITVFRQDRDAEGHQPAGEIEIELDRGQSLRMIADF